MKTNKLLLVLITLIVISCTKQSSNLEMKEDFFQYEKSESNSTSNSNEIISLINYLSGKTPSTEVIRLLNKFGKPRWDIYIKLKNEKGLGVYVFPLTKNNVKAEALLIAYQLNEKEFLYKYVDIKAKQKKLPYYGDKDGKKFTQKSLEGIIEYLNKKIKETSQPINQDNPVSNGVRINYVCWNYYGSYSDEYGNVVAWTTQIQCSYTIIFTYETLQKVEQENPDNFGGGGSVLAPIIQIDSIKIINLDPCKLNVWNKLNSAEFIGDIMTEIQSLFQISTKYNIYLSEAPNLVNKDNQPTFANTDPIRNSLGGYNLYIKLCSTKLAGSSQEFIASTIIHEMLHAIFLTQDITGRLRHENNIANNYIEIMAHSIIKAFPNFDINEARKLVWQSLDETDAYKSKTDSEKLEIQKTYGYHSSGVDGTPCQ